jgi:hypothetical protein
VTYHNQDGSPLRVDITAALDLATGVVTWTFRSVDPSTGTFPTNPFAGFLPVDDATGVGEAYVSDFIKEQPNPATGTAIDAAATVVFDTSAPITTNTYVNTIDADPPTSAVNPLPTTTTNPSFTVSWSGSDGLGSGIATFDIFVSDDGAPYQLWQAGTTHTSATYTGQSGHTYRFYNVATSNVGLVQPTPSAAQATTEVSAASSNLPTSPSPTPAPPVIIGEQPIFTRKLNRKHKPVGRPTLSGFRFNFSAAMNPATAGNPADYQVDWTSTKRAKRRLVKILHPVPFSVQYDAASHSVSLLLGGKQAFARGGQITVIAAPPDGVSGVSGVLLDGATRDRPAMTACSPSCLKRAGSRGDRAGT